MVHVVLEWPQVSFRQNSVLLLPSWSSLFYPRARATQLDRPYSQVAFLSSFWPLSYVSDIFQSITRQLFVDFYFSTGHQLRKKKFGTNKKFVFFNNREKSTNNWLKNVRNMDSWTKILGLWNTPYFVQKKILWKRREVLKLKCSFRSNFNPMWRKRLIHRVLTDNVYRLELIHPVDFYWKSWFSDSINKLLVSDGL